MANGTKKLGILLFHDDLAKLKNPLKFTGATVSQVELRSHGAAQGKLNLGTG